MRVMQQKNPYELLNDAIKGIIDDNIKSGKELPSFEDTFNSLHGINFEYNSDNDIYKSKQEYNSAKYLQSQGKHPKQKASEERVEQFKNRLNFIPITQVKLEQDQRYWNLRMDDNGYEIELSDLTNEDFDELEALENEYLQNPEYYEEYQSIISESSEIELGQMGLEPEAVEMERVVVDLDEPIQQEVAEIELGELGQFDRRLEELQAEEEGLFEGDALLGEQLGAEVGADVIRELDIGFNPALIAAAGVGMGGLLPVNTPEEIRQQQTNLVNKYKENVQTLKNAFPIDGDIEIYINGSWVPAKTKGVYPGELGKGNKQTMFDVVLSDGNELTIPASDSNIRKPGEDVNNLLQDDFLPTVGDNIPTMQPIIHNDIDWTLHNDINDDLKNNFNESELQWINSHSNLSLNDLQNYKRFNLLNEKQYQTLVDLQNFNETKISNSSIPGEQSDLTHFPNDKYISNLHAIIKENDYQGNPYLESVKTINEDGQLYIIDEYGNYILSDDVEMFDNLDSFNERKKQLEEKKINSEINKNKDEGYSILETLAGGLPGNIPHTSPKGDFTETSDVKPPGRDGKEIWFIDDEGNQQKGIVSSDFGDGMIIQTQDGGRTIINEEDEYSWNQPEEQWEPGYTNMVGGDNVWAFNTDSGEYEKGNIIGIDKDNKSYNIEFENGLTTSAKENSLLEYEAVDVGEKFNTDNGQLTLTGFDLVDGNINYNLQYPEGTIKTFNRDELSEMGIGFLTSDINERVAERQKEQSESITPEIVTGQGSK